MNTKNMKKYIYSFLVAVSVMGLTSCMEVDNFDEPEAQISGKIIDKTTGENYLTDQGDVHLRIWEKSYSLNPAPQDLNVKGDGTYHREKLFAGTYDMLAYDGSWWPCDTIRNVAIGKSNSATQNFEVTPYLKIKDFECSLGEETADGMVILTMSCRLFAPITEELPQVREIRPFISINEHCGASNHLDYYYKDEYRINLRKSWSALGDMTTGEGNTTYEIKVPVKRGYHYWVRMGANVNDVHMKYNYSEIKEVVVP